MNLSDYIKQFEGELNVRNISDNYFIARALAGAMYSIDLKIVQTKKQLFPHLASEKNLLVWCNLYGINKRLATNSKGKIQVVANVKTRLEKSTVFTYQNKKFVALESVNIEMPENEKFKAILTVQSVGVGIYQNVQKGELLKLETPISGVISDCLVVESILGGYDEENIDSLKNRLIHKIQYPPQGGSAMDYVHWALEVEGVYNAFVFPQYMGVGNVGVCIYELDNELQIPKMPSDKLISDVKNYISDKMPCSVNTLIIFKPIFREFFVMINETVDLKEKIKIDNKIKTFLLLKSAVAGHYFKKQSEETINVIDIMKIIHEVNPTVKLRYLIDSNQQTFFNIDMKLKPFEMAIYKGLQVERL